MAKIQTLIGLAFTIRKWVSLLFSFCWGARIITESRTSRINIILSNNLILFTLVYFNINSNGTQIKSDFLNFNYLEQEAR